MGVIPIAVLKEESNVGFYYHVVSFYYKILNLKLIFSRLKLNKIIFFVTKLKNKNDEGLRYEYDTYIY
jgi:hypothetical protein